MVQVWGESSYDDEFANFARGAFETLIAEFTDYLALYLQDQRGAGPETARDRASVMVPGLLAMVQGAVVQTTVFGDSSRLRVRAGIEAVLSSVEF